MTAGVQNSDPAAYLPAPRSSSSSASDPKGADPLPDFQSELQLHDPDPKETKTAGRMEKSSGKFEKNRDVPEKATNLTALTPVHVAEPAKQILPIVLALPQPDEPVNATPVKLEVPARRQCPRRSVNSKWSNPAPCDCRRSRSSRNWRSPSVSGGPRQLPRLRNLPTPLCSPIQPSCHRRLIFHRQQRRRNQSSS
jgi:hypothetical protein